MRALLFAAAAVAALTAGISPAAASPRDFQSWLAEAIDRNMTFPAELERSHASGVATVRFSVGADGRPAGVRLVESSGHRAIDRAALHTIASLDLPADAPAGPHLAVLQYGTEVSYADARAHEAQLDSALGEARLAAREIDRQRQGYAESGGAASQPRSFH
jgi:TonB family protein